MGLECVRACVCACIPTTETGTDPSSCKTTLSALARASRRIPKNALHFYVSLSSVCFWSSKHDVPPYSLAVQLKLASYTGAQVQGARAGVLFSWSIRRSYPQKRGSNRKPNKPSVQQERTLAFQFLALGTDDGSVL